MMEVPDRQVDHEGDDTADDGSLPAMLGEATTLPMTEAQKRAARKRETEREPFGFAQWFVANHSVAHS